MKKWNSAPGRLVGAGVLAAVLALSPALGRRAHAFGGIWSGSGAAVKQSAARVVFVDHPGPTVTAIVQVDYAGAAEKFAWIVPVRSMVSVGVSSSVLFDRLDAATAPRYWVAVEVAGMCVQELDREAAYGTDPGAATPSLEPELPRGPVLVAERGSVASYDYVNITVDPAASDPAQAAIEWLSMNGYDLTGADSKILSPYLTDGYGLLAFKLSRGAERGSVRPISITYESEQPVVPIRASAGAAQDDMALEVWLFGPSQAVPENYRSLVLNDALIDWSSARKFSALQLPAGGAGPFGPRLSKPKSYDALIAAAADEAGGQGFVTELAGPASQYRDKIWSTLDEESFTALKSATYEDGIDAVRAASAEYAGWDGFREALEGAITLPSGVTLDAFASDPEQHRGAALVDGAKFLELLEQKVVKPVIDGVQTFFDAPYLTRLYSRMSAAEMTADPRFVYNFELDQISNVHMAKQVVQCNPTLQRPEDAPWRMELPQGGVVVGEADTWPHPIGLLPANLKVVTLGTRGSGSVVQDNSELIGMKLFATAGVPSGESTTPQTPQHGSTIGGRQSVRTHVETPSADGGVNGGASSGMSSDEGCALSPSASTTRAALDAILLLVGAIVARRRRGAP